MIFIYREKTLRGGKPLLATEALRRLGSTILIFFFLGSADTDRQSSSRLQGHKSEAFRQIKKINSSLEFKGSKTIFLCGRGYAGRSRIRRNLNGSFHPRQSVSHTLLLGNVHWSVRFEFVTNGIDPRFVFVQYSRP